MHAFAQILLAGHRAAPNVDAAFVADLQRLVGITMPAAEQAGSRETADLAVA